MSVAKPRSIEQVARTHQREAAVVQYRKAGMTYERIAELVLDDDGTRAYADAAGAWKAYQRALSRSVIQPATEQRELMVMQIEQLWSVAYPKAIRGDMAAFRECNRLMIRKARLLGLDAPTNIRHIVTDSMTAEIEKLAAELNVNDVTPVDRMLELEAVVVHGDEAETETE